MLSNSESNATAFPSHHLPPRKKIALVLPKPLPHIFDRGKKTTIQSPSSPSSISADFANIVQQFHRNPGLLIDVVQQQEANINGHVQMLHGSNDIMTGDGNSEQSLNSTPKSDDLSIFQDSKCNQDSETSEEDEMSTGSKKEKIINQPYLNSQSLVEHMQTRTISEEASCTPVVYPIQQDDGYGVSYISLDSSEASSPKGTICLNGRPSNTSPDLNDLFLFQCDSGSARVRPDSSDFDFSSSQQAAQLPNLDSGAHDKNTGSFEYTTKDVQKSHSLPTVSTASLLPTFLEPARPYFPPTNTRTPTIPNYDDNTIAVKPEDLTSLPFYDSNVDVWQSPQNFQFPLSKTQDSSKASAFGWENNSLQIYPQHQKRQQIRTRPMQDFSEIELSSTPTQNKRSRTEEFQSSINQHIGNLFLQASASSSDSPFSQTDREYLPIAYHDQTFQYQGHFCETQSNGPEDDEIENGRSIIIPPPADQNDPLPGAQPRKQRARFPSDMYTPIWVRYEGQLKEGYCDQCEPGKWLQLKNSAYWYHKQFLHGVSSVSGKTFIPPLQTRPIPVPQVANPNVSPLTEGLCHQCQQWIPITTSKKRNTMTSTLWFRHAHKCHVYVKPKHYPARKR